MKLNDKGFLLIEALFGLLIISLLTILLLSMYQTEKRIDTYEKDVFEEEWLYIIRDNDCSYDQ